MLCVELCQIIPVVYVCVGLGIIKITNPILTFRRKYRHFMQILIPSYFLTVLLTIHLILVIASLAAVVRSKRSLTAKLLGVLVLFSIPIVGPILVGIIFIKNKELQLAK